VPSGAGCRPAPREVGGWRGAIAGPFPSAPSRTDHAPFRCSRLSSGCRSAGVRNRRISRLLTLKRTHLPPFAMWSAFPTADYYGGSVTLGLAPCRPSRVLTHSTSERAVGAPFIPFSGLVVHPPCGRNRCADWLVSACPAGPRIEVWSSRGMNSTRGDWGSGNPAFTLARGSCGTTSYTPSETSRFDGMLLSRRTFALG
jgi:hypothetical protein